MDIAGISPQSHGFPFSPRLRNCAAKAIAGLTTCIDQKGEVHNVSFGTPVFNTKQEYKEVRCTSMPYGQSLALLALGEWLRVEL